MATTTVYLLVGERQTYDMFAQFSLSAVNVCRRCWEPVNCFS